ncbi:MAG: hypothetical protein ACO25B_00895 [Chitinophagaceae bacterium]
MKIKMLVCGVIFFIAGTLVSQAQRVRVRLAFPSTIHMVAPGPSPFRGAVWVGPEWKWRGGNYVVIPGYWASPRNPRAVWIPGHWKYTRRGYIWIPGRWR